MGDNTYRKNLIRLIQCGIGRHARNTCKMCYQIANMNSVIGKYLTQTSVMQRRKLFFSYY